MGSSGDELRWPDAGRIGNPSCGVGVRRAVVMAAALAVGLGVWFRAAPLGTKSLWLDEVFTVRRTNYATTAEVVQKLRGSPFPPTHYVLVHAWRHVCDDAKLGVRGPSFLFGLLAIPATFLIWRSVIGTRAAGWATVLTGVSAWHVWLSSDAKMYAAVWLLACVSHGLFLQLLLSPDRARAGPAWGYACSTALLPLFSYTGLAVPAVQATYLAGAYVVQPQRRRNVLLLSGLSLLSLLPFTLWLPALLEAAANPRGLDWIGPARLERFWHHVFEFLGMFLCGFRADNHGDLAAWGSAMLWLHGWIVAATLVGFCVVVSRAVARSRPSPAPDRESSGASREALVYIAFSVAATILATFAISLLGRSLWGVGRYLTPAAVLVVIAAAIVVSGLRSLVARALLVGPLLAVNLGMCWLDRVATTRVPWDDVAGHVHASFPGGTTVFVDDPQGSQEAVLALGYALADARGRSTGRTTVGETRILDAGDYDPPASSFLILESARAKASTSGETLPQTLRGAYRLERIDRWQIYGKSDIPNPSVVRTVTLWKAVLENGR